MRWEGLAIVPPSPAFRFALWDAVHIKVVIEPPQSEIPVWQGSEAFEERMRALTQHGRLKLPPWTTKRKIDSHKASIHLDLTSTREEESVSFLLANTFSPIKTMPGQIIFFSLLLHL